VSEGQQVEVLVTNVDVENQRIGLSLKALETPPATSKQVEPEEEPEAVPTTSANKPRSKPLKGGVTKPSGGEKFGLKW